ncbi:MAG: PEP-CTERM sorting domain-containing protein [Armatimonadetes bacterium]|nr:PEP-CTERM sorting domain-containing protein [Armatimonadota bacterium]
MSRRIGAILKLVLTIGLAVFVASMVSATLNPLTTTLTSSYGFSDELTATVTYSGGLYHYLYELSYFQSYNSGALTLFSINKPIGAVQTNAGNDKGFINQPSENSILWSGSASVGQICTFWFDSIHSYTTVGVTLKGGKFASGDTLGLIIPEPGVIASLAIGMTGLLGFALRKRSSK